MTSQELTLIAEDLEITGIPDSLLTSIDYTFESIKDDTFIEDLNLYSFEALVFYLNSTNSSSFTVEAPCTSSLSDFSYQTEIPLPNWLISVID